MKTFLLKLKKQPTKINLYDRYDKIHAFLKQADDEIERVDDAAAAVIRYKHLLFFTNRRAESSVVNK